MTWLRTAILVLQLLVVYGLLQGADIHLCVAFQFVSVLLQVGALIGNERGENRRTQERLAELAQLWQQKHPR
jgi:hypothetical protein